MALPGFDPDLVAAAALYGHTLPLTKRPFGYRDANDEKVRRDTLQKLMRSTQRGRAGVRMSGIGIATTVVGWAAMGGFATAALATENNSFVAPAVAGAVVSATGIGLLVGGNVQAVNSLEPRR